MIKQIKEIASYEQPWKCLANKLLPYNSALNPVLTANKAFILGSTDENNLYTNVPAIIFDDFTTDSKYVDFPFLVRSSAIKIIKTVDNSIPLKYLFYIFETNMYQPQEHKRQYISNFQNLEINVHSENQKHHIVNINRRLS